MGRWTKCRAGLGVLEKRQDRQSKCSNKEARSPNHCGRGKVISITFAECVWLLSYIPSMPYTCAVCGLSDSTIFFHIIFLTTLFSEKGYGK